MSRNTLLLLLLVLATVTTANLGSNCSDWNNVYGKQYWAPESAPCRITQPTNSTELGGSGTEYCCRLYARLNAAFMFFITPKPEGLGCGATDEKQSTIYAKLYYRNCKDFAQSVPISCPKCNTTNTTLPASSPSPSPQPDNLINPVPIMTVNETMPGNETMSGNSTAGNSTTTDDDTPSNSSNSETTGNTAASDDNGQDVSIGDGSGADANAPGKEEAKNSSGSVCLHGSLRVTLVSGRTVRVDALRTGDKLLESGDIYMFSHNSRERAQFVNLTTSSEHWIAVTLGHLLHTPNGLRAAGKFKVGDTLDGGHVIVGANKFFDFGVYNPHTIRGDIIVNGLRASTYTVHVPNLAAHGALSVFRAIWRSLRLHTNVLRCGVPSFSTLSGATACIA